MADIEIHRAHDLGLEAARAAADTMAAHLKSKFGLEGEWEGDAFRFQRSGINGTLRIAEKHLDLSIALGFLMKAMRPSIEMAVKQELEKMFAAGSAAKPATKPAGATPKKVSPRPKKGD